MTSVPKMVSVYSEVVVKQPSVEDRVVVLPIATSREGSPGVDGSFEAKLTRFGKLIPTSGLLDQVSCRLLNDLRTIVLTPISLNSVLGVQLQRIVLKLPDFVLPGCIALFLIDDSSLSLQMFTNEGLFITLYVKLEDFIFGSAFSLANFKEWGNYDMPYSIETRNPHSLWVLSENLTVVPFTDGGLLQLRRSERFSAIESIVFNDSSYFDSLTKFFKKNPDNEYIDNKISVKTIISCVLLNSQYLLTLSINKKLRIWSLHTNSVIFEQELVASPNHFDPHSSNLSKLIDSPATNAFILATLVPLKEERIIIWNLSIENDQCSLNEISKVKPPKFDQTSWVTQSYMVQKSLGSDSLKILLLLRSNKLEKLLQGNIDLNTNEITWFNSQNSKIEELPDSVTNLHFPESINEYYLSKFLTTYNQLILETVLNIFQSHYNYKTSSNKLQDQILEVVQYNLDANDLEYLKNLKNQWSKFDGSCKELLKQCSEPVDIGYSSHTDIIYVMKSLGLSIFKKSSHIQLLSQNTLHNQQELQLPINFPNSKINSTNVSQLISLASDFKKIIDEVALNDLEFNIITVDDIETQMAKLFEELVSPSLNEDLISQLLTRLSSIPNVLDVIDYVSGSLGYPNKGRFISSKLSNLGRSILLESLKSDLLLYKNFTIGLLLIMLVIDNNDQVNGFFQKLCSKYKSYCLISRTVNDEDLFWNIVFENFDLDGFRILNVDQLNEVVEAIFEYALSSNSFLYKSVVSLLSLNKAQEIVKLGSMDFLSKSPIDIFLKSLVYLKLGEDDKAFKMLTQNASRIIEYELDANESSDLELISSLSLVFGSSPMRFYIVLTNFFIDNDYIKNAYNLAKLALQNYDITKDSESKDSDTIHWNLFQLSLKLSDYDTSFQSINSLSQSLRLKALKIFVLNLLETKSVKVLLDYNFKENIPVIDSIILSLATQQDFLMNSLNYYKVLYSWRLSLGDKRGAAEALYGFIRKFEGESFDQSKSKSLYLTILNVLRTIRDTDDQWIVVDALDETRDDEILSFNDLQKEFDRKFSITA